MERPAGVALTNCCYNSFTIARPLASRFTMPRVTADATLRQRFRVRLFDCDGLREMTAAKYPMYMDLIRWELIGKCWKQAPAVSRTSAASRRASTGRTGRRRLPFRPG